MPDKTPSLLILIMDFFSKAPAATFALFGALISLANTPPMGWLKSIVALVTGFITAVACGPLVHHLGGIPSEASYGVTFLLALGSVRAVPPLLDWIAWVAKNPIRAWRGFWSAWRGTNGGGS